MNFSLPITADLVLTVSVCLAQLPKFRDTKQPILLAMSIEILEGWAEEILARKRSVSLEAITWNAVRLASSSRADESRDLTTIGDYLIQLAESVETIVLEKQALELAKRSLARVTQPIENRLTAVLKGAPEVSFSKAAKTITGLKNASEATLRLKEYLKWLRYRLAIDSALQRELDRILEERPKISQSGIDVLKTYYPLFKDLGFTTKKLESRLFGKLRKGAQKKS
jgi:hypothetical protein